MKPENQTYTAVLSEKGYKHFGVTKSMSSMYGVKEDEVLNVELSIADDQTVPPPPQNDPKTDEPDYWGWFDAEKKKFTNIYPKHFLLNMCFPYGMEAEEERGRGKAYRLNVKTI